MVAALLAEEVDKVAGSDGCSRVLAGGGGGGFDVAEFGFGVGGEDVEEDLGEPAAVVEFGVGAGGVVDDVAEQGDGLGGGGWGAVAKRGFLEEIGGPVPRLEFEEVGDGVAGGVADVLSGGLAGKFLFDGGFK